jgi:bifunctional non-homologous end joining protein LigD
VPEFTIDFPTPLQVSKRGDHWYTLAGDQEVKLSNLTKVFYPQTGYTKGDLLAAYANAAPYLLPHLHDRPLTLRRMPDGAEGDEFYEKQAPAHTPDWVPRAYIEGHGSRGAIDFLMAQDLASLLYVVNLGCIEMHPMHARQQTFDRPDYTFFDLDPFPPIEFSTVREVARLVRVALDNLGLRSYPKISGATGIVVYVPLDGSHTYDEARAFTERVCRIINKMAPHITTMEPRIENRAGKVFLDYAMVSEGRNIASMYSARPTPTATFGVPVTWDEMDSDVRPEDFTIANVGDLAEGLLDGGSPKGHNLTEIMVALGIDVEALRPAHVPASTPGDLAEYQRKRTFDVTPEPAGTVAAVEANTFMIHKHHARRLHFDLRLERGGVLVSWAVPKGLPEEPNIRHLAVHVEDHPLEYGGWEGTIPKGEYGAGESRIFDSGTYEALEWTDKKVTIRLRGGRLQGEYHLVNTQGKNWIIFRSARDAPLARLPMPSVGLEPMLATGGGEPFDGDDWVFEPKWDGVRTLAHVDGSNLKLVSRRGRDVTAQYGELGGIAEQLSARNGLIDGEIVALDDTGRPSFEKIQARFTLGRPSQRAQETNPVDFIAFDLLWLDGESLMDRPLEERRALLERHVVPGKRIQNSLQVPRTGKALFDVAKERGLEGIIAKKLGSLYRPGKDWVKIKAFRSQDCVIVGWASGQGARDGSIGSLLAAVQRDGALSFAGHIGTGFSDRTLATLAEALTPLETDTPPLAVPDDLDTRGVHWVRPELVCSAEYLEFTSQGRMRAASFRGLRDDILPDACIVEPS